MLTRRSFLQHATAAFFLPMFLRYGTELRADIVIAGGGLGGVAAALAALRNGRRVILTEATDWIGGQVTAQAVPLDEHQWIESHGCTRAYRAYRNALREYYREYYPLTEAARTLVQLNPGNADVTRLAHEPRVSLAVLEALLAPYAATSQLTLLLQHKPIAAEVDGDFVRALKVKSLASGAERVLHAKYFLDATELGELLPLTRTEYVTGFESQQETGELHAPQTAQPLNMQACTWCFAMEYRAGEEHTITKPEEYAFWRNYKPQLKPAWPGKLLELQHCNPQTLKPLALGFNPEREEVAPGQLNLMSYRRVFDKQNFVNDPFASNITIVNWPMNDYFLGPLYEVPEAEAVLANTAGGGGASGTNSGSTTITLVPPDQRNRTQQQIADALSVSVRQLTEARTFVTQEQTISVGGGGGRSALPVQYVIQAPDFEKLRAVLPQFLEAANNHPTFSTTDLNLKFNKPELVISIDRERSRTLGVSVSDIAQTLQLTLSGSRYGYFIKDGKQYQIIGQLTRANRDEPVDLKSIFVRNRSGELIQLDNVITVSEQANPPQLFRFNRYIAATVSAGLAPGHTLGDGIKAMDEIAAKVLDESFSTSLAGAARDFSESSSSLIFVFILALVLTYLVLAAQFESFRDPFIIMFTVPLAVAGALLSLWYFNQTINIFSQIGQIMLIGLVTKNGILIVEFANQRKAAGLSVVEAVQSAATARFRPILMTSLSTILGILPIALGLGGGAESRVSMGIAVVGGMIFASGLTLYVIPAIYSYFSKEFQPLHASTAPVRRREELMEAEV